MCWKRALDTINLHVNQKMGVPFADLIPFINEECRIAAEYV